MLLSWNNSYSLIIIICGWPASVTIGDNGMVYFLSSTGSVDALSGGATLEWSFLTGSTEANVCTPAIDANGNMYVYADDLYALNSTGHLLWRFPIPGTTSPSYDSSPALGDGDVIYFCDEYALYAVSLSGDSLWNFTAPDLFSKAPAINIDGSIIISGMETVYAVDPQDGSMLWSSAMGTFLSEVSISADGTIFVGSSDNILFAMDQTGTPLWNYTTTGFITGRVAVTSEGDVIVKDSTPTLYRLSSEGTLRWDYHPPTPSISSSFAVGLDGVVYFTGGGDIYAVTSDGNLLWSWTSIDATEASPPAIGGDGTVYVSTNNAVYAVNNALSPAPSSAPSTFPTVLCPGGAVVASSEGQQCEDCDEGEYSDGVLCRSCSRGRTNVGHGNSECDLYVSTVDPIIVYAAAAVYLFCVMFSFVLSVVHGGPVLSLAGVLLVVGDQISDMIFATQATFYSSTLLMASGVFCIIPLLPFAFLVLFRTSPLELRCVRMTARMHRRISGWHVDSAGWLFHKLTIHSLHWKFFPFIVIMAFGDLMWPFIRVAFMVVYAAGMFAFQVLLLVLGVLFHATKLITHRETNDRFWWLWCEECSTEGKMREGLKTSNNLEEHLTGSNVIEGFKDDAELVPLTNAIILMETIFENIPQLLIQCINNELAYDSKVWSTLAIISITFTSLMVVTVGYHFGFYMIFAEQRHFSDVPKFDLFVGNLSPEDDVKSRGEATSNEHVNDVRDSVVS